MLSAELLTNFLKKLKLLLKLKEEKYWQRTNKTKVLAIRGERLSKRLAKGNNGLAKKLN